MVLIPRKALYIPELYPHATSLNVAADARVSFLKFSMPDFKRYACWLRTLASSRINDVFVLVTSDARKDFLSLNAGARLSLDRPLDLSVYCRTALDLIVSNKTGAPVSNYQLNCSYLVGLPPEEVEKLAPEVVPALRLPIPPALFGQARPPPLLEPFKLTLFDIVEVSERVTVAAGGEERVGPPVTVAAGEKITLFDLACERSTTPGDPTIKIVREGEDLGLDLDCYAMTDLDYSVNTWINALETLEVKLASTAGVTNYRVRYRYAHAEIPTPETLLWKELGVL